LDALCTASFGPSQRRNGESALCCGKGGATWLDDLDRRPVVVAIAGPNGAGRTTFFESQFSTTGLRFLNANLVAQELEVDADEAARVISELRTELASQRARSTRTL